MFAFAVVVIALFALSAALAPVWITSRRARRRLALVKLCAGAAGLLGAAAVAVGISLAVRGTADAEYAAWIGETVSLFGWLFVGVGLGAAVLTALSALVSPTKYHTVRAALSPAAAFAVLFLTVLFAAAGENDGAVKADTLLRLIGLFAALLPMLGAAADQFLFLRTLPEEPKPPKKHRRKR